MVAFPVGGRKGSRGARAAGRRRPVVHCALALGDYIPGEQRALEARDRFLM
jgi:hypothetical protein